MNTEIANKLDEIALLAMMLHEGDGQGFEFILDSVVGLAAACAGPDSARLRASAEYVVAQRGAPPADLLALIRAFIDAAQRFLSDPVGVVLPGEQDQYPEPVTGGWGADLSPDADTELIVDFIEKHLLLLEELESSLLAALTEGSGVSGDLTAPTRSYLHNIKGDAGTVGLLGVERVTHVVEDLLVEHPAETLIEVLIAWKEWVGECMKACTERRPPAELSGPFIEQLRAMTPRLPAIVTTSAGLVEPASPTGASLLADSYQLEGDTAILVEFAAEAEEHLTGVEEILLAAQDAAVDGEQINALFRAIHSIKGGSSYFNLVEITRISHVVETILDRARKGSFPFTDELRGLLLAYVDVQRTLLGRARSALTAGGAVRGIPEAAALFARAESLLAGRVATAAVPSLTTPPPGAAPVAAEVGEREGASGGDKLEIKTFVKVETGRLDRLIEYIGELVISSSMLIRNCRDLLAENEHVITTTHQLEKISREIQEIGMSMRLIPIKGLFQKMSRLVWDTSRKIGKEITFDMSGEETELDRLVIEKLADPLMHMVRNAIDHGIETPEERARSGKARAGEVSLAAFHFGGNIHIRITDDGRGLDPERLLAKAVERGIVDPSQKLSRQECYQLIFAAGFSTAERVTDISGRGVGMDVVRRNIEALRGRIHIESEVGRGSTFTIELPLTLAIIDGMEVQLGTERFIIPTHSILEFVKPSPDMITTPLDRVEMLQFRGSFLPLFRLAALYGIEPLAGTVEEGIIVVVESNGNQVAILLDAVVGTYSTVIKSLGPTFEGIRGLAGCAIMPDGGIGLILDIGTLVDLARSTRVEPTRLPTPSPVAMSMEVH